MTTFQRHYLKEVLKVFFLFIGAFYFLYVLIDYSAHTKTFHGLSWRQVTLYYSAQFSKRGEMLLPFALALAGVKVLTSASLQRECLSLVTGGIRIRRILFPFVLLGVVCTTALYLNSELIQPQACSYLHTFEEQFFKERGEVLQVKHLHVGESQLLYQRFDRTEKQLTDVFWLKSKGELFHIQNLTFEGDVPMGHNIDHLIRSGGGPFVFVDHYDATPFPPLALSFETVMERHYPPEWESVSHLIFKGLASKEAKVVTFAFYKLLMPLVCILAALTPLPFCIRFGRSHPLFFIYTLSLTGLIVFFTLVNASVILAENQVFPPLLVLGIPFLLTAAGFATSYARTH